MTDKNIKPLEGEVVAIKQSPASAMKPGVFINTLNLVVSPAKTITKPLHRHYHRKYHGKYKHAKKIFILDLVLVSAAAALFAASLYFFFAKPKEQNPTVENLPKPAVAVSWEIPEKILVGQNFNLTINYQNNTLEKIERLLLAPALPNDLAVISSNAVSKDNFWVVENLEPQKSGQIQIIGFLRSLPSQGKVALTLQAFLEKNKEKIPQGSLLKYLTVAENDFNLSANLQNDKNSLKPGEEATLEIHYQNKTGRELKKVNFTLNLPAGLTADAALSAKKEILAGEKGVMEFKIKLVENFDANFLAATGLALRPSVSFYFVDQPTELLRSFAPALNIKITSQVKLHAEARYFTAEGDQLGRGPLPPKVEQTTKYWVNWFVTTAPNAIKNTTLLGHLPEGVVWTGKTNVTEGEQIKFDPVTRFISWQNERIAATPGGRCPCAGVGFEVAITPTADDAEKILTLLNQLSIQAVDEATGEELKEFSPNVTTDLIKDGLAKGKGIVQ